MSTNIRINRICQQCGKEFEAKTTATKTCSDTCAKRAYKAHQRAAKIEVSNEQTQQVQMKPIESLREYEFLTVEEKKAQVKATLQKAREAGLRQVQRRLVALDLSRDELIRLFAKTSLSDG